MTTGEAGMAFASVTIDTIQAPSSVSTWITVAFVDIYFAIRTGGARFADALITVYQILTDASILARIRFTFVDLLLT